MSVLDGFRFGAGFIASILLLTLVILTGVFVVAQVFAPHTLRRESGGPTLALAIVLLFVSIAALVLV